MPLPNWNAVRQSLISAIKAALPLQIARTNGGRIAGVGLHIDACYGSAGLYLLPEVDAKKLSADAVNNIGDWPISTDWVPDEDHSKAFAEFWRPWDEWFHEHLDDLSELESDQKFRQLLRVACEAMREVEGAGCLDRFSKTEDFKIIIAEHDEPERMALERYGLFANTGAIRVHGDLEALKRAAGGWANDDPEGLEQYLEQTRRQRKIRRPEISD